MIKKLTVVIGAIAVTGLVGCAATKLSAGAQKVYLSHSKPAANCKFLGQVTGGQGNTFTGAFTTNKNLVQGTMNDIRNQAYALGGNYVQITGDRGQNVHQASTNYSESTESAYRRGHRRRHWGDHNYYRGTSGGSSSSESTQFLGEVITGNVYKCP